MAERNAGIAGVARMDLDELLAQAKGKVPPGLTPAGQCPYCHHDLERRQVAQEATISRTPTQGGVPARLVLLTFWACTNDECCLMFWRHPRASWRQPITDDAIEH